MAKFKIQTGGLNANIEFESDSIDDVLKTLNTIREANNKAALEDAKQVIAEAVGAIPPAAPVTGDPQNDPASGSLAAAALTVEPGGQALKSRRKRVDQIKGATGAEVASPATTEAPSVAPAPAASAPTLSSVRDALLAFSKKVGAPETAALIASFTGPDGEPCRRVEHIRDVDYQNAIDKTYAGQPQ